MSFLEDGLEVLKKEIDIKSIMLLIESTAKWADPKVFHLLPVWFPEHARNQLLYKNNWEEPQGNTNRITNDTVHKKDSNTYANKAMCLALGLKSKNRPNWSCCHIWGVDDPTFQTSNSIIKDPKYYSCIGNMVLLPTPLKAFTDAMPEIKTMLRVCAYNLYGFECSSKEVEEKMGKVKNFSDWNNYPKSWPKVLGSGVPKGTIEMNVQIHKNITKRKQDIKNALSSAGVFYRKQQVNDVIEFWKINLGG